MVYFMRAEGLPYIKIGYCDDAQIHQRVKSLQTGCPTRLRIVAAIPGNAEAERAMHREFALHRTYGEWFELAPVIVARMEAAYTVHGAWWKQFASNPASPPRRDHAAEAVSWITGKFRERRQWDAIVIGDLAKIAGISRRQLWSEEVKRLPIRKRQILGDNGDRQWIWTAAPGWPDEIAREPKEPGNLILEAQGRQ
jgi:hypothetical protein